MRAKGISEKLVNQALRLAVIIPAVNCNPVRLPTRDISNNGKNTYATNANNNSILVIGFMSFTLLRIWGSHKPFAT